MKKSLEYVFENDGSTTVKPTGDCRTEDMVTVVFHSISYLAEIEKVTPVHLIEQMLETQKVFEEENKDV